MAIVGYGRVSTADQDLTVQLEQLQAVNCERIYQEKESGVKQDRPELAKMLDFVRAGDTVIVCKLDRIARSTRHLLEIIDHLEKKEVAFRALNINLDTSTATGKFMLTMLGAVAELERSLMLERQVEGIRIAKAAGKYKGRKPTAMAKSKQVIDLANQGEKKEAIAKKLNIGSASVYRILRDARFRQKEDHHEGSASSGV